MNKLAPYLLLAMLASSCAGPTHGPFYVNTQYGSFVGYGIHPGIDLAVKRGTPVIAASDGQVLRIRDMGSDGTAVVVTHGEAFMSDNAHLIKVYVVKEQLLKRGQLIGLSGETDSPSRRGFAHLHFGICKIGNGGCNYPDTFDPDTYWLGGQPRCFDPKMDYAAFAQDELTLPIACGDYGKALSEMAGIER